MGRKRKVVIDHKKLLALLKNSIFTKNPINKASVELGVHRATLYRLIKEKTGMSPREYLKKIKFEIIKNFLMETDEVLKRIHDKLGYSHISSLCRAFKKAYDKTVLSFRKEYTKRKMNKFTSKGENLS